MKRWKVTRVEVNLQTIWFNLIDIHIVYLKFWNFFTCDVTEDTRAKRSGTRARRTTPVITKPSTPASC